MQSRTTRKLATMTDLTGSIPQVRAWPILQVVAGKVIGADVSVSAFRSIIPGDRFVPLYDARGNTWYCTRNGEHLDFVLVQEPSRHVGLSLIIRHRIRRRLLLLRQLITGTMSPLV